VVVLKQPPLPARGAWLRRAATLLVAAALAACALAGHAQGNTGSTEYQIKAAFLYKFLSFVEWPAQALPADTPLQVGVLGADTLADELAKVVASRPVNGRPVMVRKVRSSEALGELHVLFVGRGSSERVPQILSAARGRALLTVSESDDAFALGSAINFVVVDDKVRFDVALQRAEQSGLKISARLLTAARKVSPSL
jgi:hypothetical protein